MKAADFIVATALMVGGAAGAEEAASVVSGPITLEPQFFTNLGSKRVQYSYGPFLVPGMMDPATQGMKDFTMPVLAPPCYNCSITAIVFNLIFDDGTTADAANGMWFHHAVLINRNRSDITCPQEGQRFAASGNERTQLDLTKNSTIKAGYYVNEGDMFAMGIELMNMDMDARNATTTIQWEFLPDVPEDFMTGDPIWLDVTGGCGDSDVDVPSNPVFNLSLSPAWEAGRRGEVVWAAGHLHDGGANIELIKNDKVVCDLVPSYDSGGHIASMPSDCYDIGMVNPTDNFTISAYYNMTAHPGMRYMNGTEMPVMGIMVLFLGIMPN